MKTPLSQQEIRRHVAHYRKQMALAGSSNKVLHPSTRMRIARATDKYVEKYKDHEFWDIRYGQNDYVEERYYPISCMLCDCDLQCMVNDPDCPEELCEIRTSDDIAAWEKWNENRSTG